MTKHGKLFLKGGFVVDIGCPYCDRIYRGTEKNTNWLLKSHMIKTHKTTDKIVKQIMEIKHACRDEDAIQK